MPTLTMSENPNLKRERQNCSFDKEEITFLIDGGADKTRERREMETYIFSDPELKDPIPIEYLSHVDKHCAELKKACLLIKKLNARRNKEAKNRTGRAALIPAVAASVMKEGNPVNLHFIMFMPALLSHGTEEQQAKWLPKAYNLEIIGTYAQTELGHGTFLRGLETTATYDPKTKEFILDTPTLSAYKWWPGGLGNTANYAIVMAQLYTGGRCEGTHPFMVQLRSEETHDPLPGITIGEIGPKLGLNSNNNGYLGFNKVSIPLDHLLMKNSKVLEDGTYIKSKNQKLNYASMVFVRVLLVGNLANELRKAVTIATRYSCVRHQSELEPGAPEPQIIDYQAQQNKLFPPLAATFAFLFASAHLWTVYNKATASIERGDLNLLPDLHGLSCAMKALSSSEAAYFVETLRKDCGGHGYMTCSNFPRIYGLCTAAITYEGENTVLWLQVARQLVKAWKKQSGGSSVAYLIHPRFFAARNDLSLEGIVDFFKRVATGLVEVAVKELEQRQGRGEAFHDAWNYSAIYLIRAAQSHARYFVADRFVKSVKQKDNFSAPVRQILAQLCELFLVYWIMERKGDFVLFAGLTQDQVSQLESKYAELLAAIRPQAVNLVDSFDIRDEVLNSALGCWDGNVYQRLFDEAAKSPLNKTQVHQESYEKYLKPLMKSNI